MNSDELKGKWKQLKGDVRKHWAKLTDDDVENMKGHKEDLVGRIQERYGSTRDDAEKQVNEWLDRLKK